MTTTDPGAPDVKKIWKLIEDTRFCFLATGSSVDDLYASPLTNQKIEEDGVIWFFIDRNGKTAESVRAYPRVLLTYANIGDDFYASLQGHASVIVDAGKAREMWSKLAEAWFPGGPDDAKLGLLRVDVDHGEVWEPASNKLVQFMSMVSAAVTHTPPKHVGEHKTFNA